MLVAGECFRKSISFIDGSLPSINTPFVLVGVERLEVEMSAAQEKVSETLDSGLARFSSSFLAFSLIVSMDSSVDLVESCRFTLNGLGGVVVTLSESIIIFLGRPRPLFACGGWTLFSWGWDCWGGCGVAMAATVTMKKLLVKKSRGVGTLRVLFFKEI